MRRLSLTAAAIVSTAVLLTTTSVLAIAPAKVNMGTLKPQGSWKVGTVDQGSERYCAMVGTYNNNVVAAFARNPQGLGSLALDFGDGMFTPGKSYDVSLTAEGLGARSFTGRASTERSLVIQIGQDGSFYDALSKNGTLAVEMSSASLRLDLPKFSGSHKDLVACAGQLSADEQTAEPKQRTAELPIDRELAELSQARTTLAAASTKADDIQKNIETKASSLDALEAQLEAEARAEIESSKTRIAVLDNKQSEVREKLASKGVSSDNALDLSMVEPAAGVPDLPVPAATTNLSPGRKLLAAIGGKSDLSVPPSTGSSSRDIEARELGLADANRAAAETAKALELKNEIAAIEAEKNAAAQKTLAAFDSRQNALDAQGAKLAEKRDNSLAKLSAAAAAEDKSKKLRADVIAQQAKIAEVSETKQKEVQALPAQLAATNTEFESRIAALEAERNQLRDQVNSVVAENERLKQSQGQGKPEDRLEIAQLKKQLLDMETQRQAELARASAAQKELDDARQQIAGLRQGSQDEMARLANLQRTLETERAQLSAERGAIAAERTAIAANVSAAAGKERADIENLRKALEKKQADLETVAVEQGAEAARLQQEKDTLEVAKAAVEKDKSSAAVLASSQKLVESERAELNTLRDRIKTLETDLASAREQAAVASAAVAAAPKPVANVMGQAEKAELSRLKDENASLRQRLASMLSGESREKTAEVVQPEAPVAVTSEVKAVTAQVEEAPVVAAVETKMEAPVVDTKVSAPVEIAQQDNVPVDIKPAPSTAGGSPVLASLFGKRVPAVETAAAAVVEQKPAVQNNIEWKTPVVEKQAETKTASLTAQELNAAEPAAGTPELSPLPGNDKRMPAVPAAKVEQEVVVPVAPTAPEVVAVSEETKVEEVAVAKEEPVAQKTVEQIAAVPASDAELEIARMAPITASVPLNKTTRDVPVQKVTMRREKPQVQDADPAQDKGVFGIFGRALGYNAASEHAKAAQEVEAGQHVAAAEPQIPQDAIIRVTRPSEPVAQAQPVANSEITTADGNRAAAFLDNIMAFHRPDGSDATGPAVASRTRNFAVEKPKADLSHLNAIETAAGAPSMAAVAATAPAQTRAAPAAAATVALDQLLRQAGLGNVTVVSSPTGVAQWSTGALNGMYERQSANGGFDQQVDAYLARYQDDCPGKLQVSKGSVQPTPSGSVRVVDIACGMSDNSYATSIVFTQSQGGFSALLHAGQSAARSDVKQVGERIAGVLRTAGGIGVNQTAPSVVPASFAQQPVAAQPTERPRFRVEIQAPSAAPEGVYDLPTTIIE